MLHPIHFFKNFYLLTLSFFLYNCQLKIPFKYFPVYNYNYSSPSQIMESIIQQKLYANIEIGTPKKTIQIPLFFNSNDFYISDCPKKEFESGTFSDLKFYNQSDSTTHEDLDDYDDYYSYNGELFEMATYHKDRFYFNNNNYELEFYIPISYKEVNSGGIGMLLLPYSELTDSTPNVEKSFFGKLKKKKLINQYYWSIFFNSREYKKEEEGFILLGILPHEIDGDLGLYQKGYFNERYIKTVNMANIRPYIKNTFEMDMIYAYEGNNKNKVIVDFPSGNNDYRKVELDYHSGGVKAPANLRQYYHRVFEKYFANGECFNDTLKRNSYTFRTKTHCGQVLDNNCYKDCPIVEYNGISNEMISTIKEIIIALPKMDCDILKKKEEILFILRAPSPTGEKLECLFGFQKYFIDPEKAIKD